MEQVEPCWRAWSNHQETIFLAFARKFLFLQCCLVRPHQFKAAGSVWGRRLNYLFKTRFHHLLRLLQATIPVAAHPPASIRIVQNMRFISSLVFALLLSCPDASPGSSDPTSSSVPSPAGSYARLLPPKYCIPAVLSAATIISEVNGDPSISPGPGNCWARSS